MNADRYTIAQLVNDVEHVCAQSRSERAIVAALRPLLRRAALSASAWVDTRFYDADASQGFGVHLLHERPDHTLAVFAISWLPHRGTPPHNHGTWAVVVGVDGAEKNEFFERVDDGSRSGYAELKKIGEKLCGAGDVVAMPSGVIHGVWNETDTVSLSLHVYGKHINYTGRSQFDVAKKTETPFVVKTAQH